MRLRTVPLLFVVGLAGCARSRAGTETLDAATTTTTSAKVEPVRVEKVDLPEDRPAFVLRGVRDNRHPIVFLAGMCGHPEGYVQSFARAAADHGVVIGVQGENNCGNDGLTTFGYDLKRTNERIDAAVAAAGEPPLSDAIVVGYSQGAERAERLAAQWPKKYTRLILIASPIDPKPRGPAVFMAGNFDISKARMSGAAKRLGKKGLFLPLPKAHHGEMGETPNDSMATALDFVDPRSSE